MAYGSIKVDNIIYDDSGDVTLPISSIQSSISGILTVTGDIKTTGGDVVAEAGVFVGTLGAAATPTYTFSGDNNTGLYASAADQISITTSGTAKLTVKSDGNVGIGTTSPSTLLDVRNESAAGNYAYFEASSDGGARGLQFSSSDNGAGLGAAHKIDAISGSYAKISLATGGTDALTIDSSGNVGIGESSPSTKLHLKLDTDKHIRFQGNIGEIGSVPGFQGTTDAGALTGLGMRGSDIRFAIGSSEAMRIDSSGRLLVGHSATVDTSTFNSNLQIMGTDAHGSSATLGRFSADASSSSIHFSKSRDTTKGSHTIVADNDSCGNIFWWASDGVDYEQVAQIGAEIDGTPGSGDTPGALTFSTTADTTPGSSTSTERMRIDSSGNVGIGTTSPSVPLHVADSTNLEMRFDSDGTRNIVFADIDGTYDAQIEANAAGKLWITTRQAQGIDFGINNSTKMSIDSSGRLLVGTTSNYTAAARLEVVGEAATTNDLIPSIVVNSKTTGTAAAGVGTGMIFLGSMTGQDNVELGRIGFHNTNVSGAYGDFVVQTRPNGTSLERLRILNDGSLRHTPYGDTSTQTYLKVDGSVSTYTFKAQRDGAVDTDFSWETQNGGTLNECVRILHDGNVGIGTALTDNFGTGHRVVQIHSGSTANSYLSLTNNTTGDQGADAGLNLIQTGVNALVNNRSVGYLAFQTSDIQRMQIASSGAHGLTANSGIDVMYVYTPSTAGTSTSIFRGGYSATANTPFTGTDSIYIWSNGNIQNTNDSYGQISDEKLKENIVDAGSQWDDFKAVRFRKYNFKAETGHETHTQLGVIAQELELISPGLVYETVDKDKDGNDLGTTTKAVKSSILTKKALVALQEAMAKIETLEAKVAALEAA